MRNFREESEGLRSLSRGNAHTQSLGYRHGDGRSTEGRRRKKDRRWSRNLKISIRSSRLKGVASLIATAELEKMSQK